MQYSEGKAVMYRTSPEGISFIALDRRHRKNAVDPATAKKLYDAFIAFESDSTQKVCVFHGQNGTFCSGFDLNEVEKSGESPQLMDPAKPNTIHVGAVEGRNQGPMGPTRLTLKKPVVCAVSGYAVAGGLELSLLADMRVVEEDAIFGVFCRRWGVPLIDGGTVRLQAIVGLGRALDMILTGRAVGAQEALAMGLASRIVPRGQALEEATKIARLLTSFPQDCMNMDRASCYYAAYEASSAEEALRHEFQEGIKVISTESVQGAKKFKGGAGRHGSL